MLGPSGSGKTTVLRMVAGLRAAPPTGQILLGGDDVTGRPPFARDVNTVFQDYALFPHMSVLQNVEYGLRVKKVARVGAPDPCPRGARDRPAAAATATGARTSSPAASGSGSRWRGRWSTGPRCCCSTSRSAPSTSSCAARCRSSSSRSSASVGITFVFVTHDQEEALTMSDRIAVFNDGRVEQVATPVELYEQPATAFVAGFVGTSNLLEGEVGRRRSSAAPGPVSIRPGEDHACTPGTSTPPATRTGRVATGVVGEVVYLGAVHALGGRPRRGRCGSPSCSRTSRARSTTLLGRRGERVTLSLAARPRRASRDPPDRPPAAADGPASHRGDPMKKTTTIAASLAAGLRGRGAAGPRAAARTTPATRAAPARARSPLPTYR